jgi:hypothetical protein
VVALCGCGEQGAWDLIAEESEEDVAE